MVWEVVMLGLGKCTCVFGSGGFFWMRERGKLRWIWMDRF